MSKYLKGWLMPSVGILFFLMLVQGGWWMWAPFVTAIVFFVGADALLPRDESEPPKVQIAPLLNLPLYLILPLLCLLNFTVLWMFGSGDILGFGSWLKDHAGVDLFAARENTSSWLQWAGCIVRSEEHTSELQSH